MKPEIERVLSLLLMRFNLTGVSINSSSRGLVGQTSRKILDDRGKITQEGKSNFQGWEFT